MRKEKQMKEKRKQRPGSSEEAVHFLVQAEGVILSKANHCWNRQYRFRKYQFLKQSITEMKANRLKERKVM